MTSSRQNKVLKQRGIWEKVTASKESQHITKISRKSSPYPAIGAFQCVARESGSSKKLGKEDLSYQNTSLFVFKLDHDMGNKHTQHSARSKNRKISNHSDLFVIHNGPYLII